MARPKQSKNQVQERLEREAAERAEAERRGRFKRLAGGLGVTVVIVVAALILGREEDPTDGASTSTVAGVELSGIEETRTLLAGIPQDGTLLGDPKAPVTIHEFADLKCPACRRFEIEKQPDVVTSLVRPGRANIRLHLINIIDRGHGTSDGARLLTVANNLAAADKLWPFAHTTYFNQGDENDDWATERRLREIAAGAPGVGDAAIDLRETPAGRSVGARAADLAARLKLEGTPSFFVEARGTGRLTKVDDPVDGLPAAVSDAATRSTPATR